MNKHLKTQTHRPISPLLTFKRQESEITDRPAMFAVYQFYLKNEDFLE